MYDRRCNTCGASEIDCWEAIATADYPCACGGQMQRAWVSKPAAVIGDEIDEVISHGMCNLDGTPHRWRSREELKREMKRRGRSPLVRHVGEPGSDKSKHTSRWV